MRKFMALILSLYPCLSWADPIVKNYYAQGKAFCQSSEGKTTLPTDVSKVPGYQDSSILPQTSLTGETIGAAVQNTLKDNKEAAFLTETYQTRPRFDLDVTADPLFRQADEVIANPEKYLGVEEATERAEVKVTRHSCTKGYNLSERRCRWTNVPVKTGTRKEKKVYTVNLSGYEIYQAGHSGRFQKRTQVYNRWSFSSRRAYSEARTIQAFKSLYKGVDAASGQVIPIALDTIIDVEVIAGHGEETYFQTKHERHWGARYVEFKVTTEEEVPVFELHWQNNCEDLEAITDQGTCEYTSKYCIEGPGTKSIEGVPVYAECWAEEAVYQCRQELEDTCKSLLNQGCAQVGSRCLKEEDGDEKRCLQWEQTYECYEGDPHLPKTTLSGPKPFCLDGDCAGQAWAPNQDMADSLSKLAIFSKMREDMNAQANTVFKGTGRGCSRFLTGFKDCCKLGGWGKGIGLAGCDDEARQLSEYRKANKCILIGTYCAEKKLRVCIRKKTTFCCYESKLARIIHEQGKAQLGLSFGSPEHPQCEALTLDQLTQIDFSKVDFSELFEELFAKTKIPNPQTLTKNIQKSMSDKTYFNTHPKEQMTQGRQHGDF